jgi:hypothetical protein
LAAARKAWPGEAQVTARTLLVVLAIVYALAAPAAAQDPKAGADASAAAPPAASPAPPRSEAASAAAREMVRMIFVDSGIVPAALEMVAAQRLPALAQQVRSSALYGRLSRQRRAAVDAYIDTFDDLLTETVNARMPAVIERATAATLAMYTDSELAEIVAFLRTESARTFIVAAMTAGLGSAAGGAETIPEMTPQQMADFAAFEHRPAGRRFGETSVQWFQMLGTTFESTLADAGPALSQRVQRDFCLVLERDCPAALRQELGLN